VATKRRSGPFNTRPGLGQDQTFPF
jgi:hypothetical protein